MGPYIGLAFLLILIAVAIAIQKAPPIVEEFPDAGTHEGGTRGLFRVLWRNKRYRFGVVAQFSNVAAQVCTWTFLIQYVEQALGGSLEKGGAFLQASLIVFLISRFVMTWVIGRIRATKVLAVLAFLAVGLCLFAMASPNLAGVLAVVALSFCLSLMFPTIYGVALKGLGPATKFGAAGLVMAIVGGAIMPLVQGSLVDATSPAFSFIVPAFCFAVVGLYALYDLKAEPSVTGGEPVREVGPATPAQARRNPPRARRERPPRGQRPPRSPWPRWRSAPAAATRRRAPRRARSNSRSCRGGPRGPSRRPSTPCSPPSARQTRASRSSTARSPGGAGSNAIVELAKRLQRNDPPDVWQTFAGKSVQGYASRGVIRSVASVFDARAISRDG